MNKSYIYLYGMIAISSSFLLDGGFLKPDMYSEIKAKYRFPGGETGTCATVLSSLGAQVKMDGNHIGYDAKKLITDFYKDKSVDLDSLHFDDKLEALEDYVIISDDMRTPMGMFGKFFSNAYSSGNRPWSKPREDDIKNCTVAAIDPYFWEESELAVNYCIKHNKPFVTIDCEYDSYFHRNSAVSVISGEGIINNYHDKTREELFPLFQKNGGGLTIITNGGNRFVYGRKGERMKTFEPYKVNVASTLGAGDSFKAGCAFALMNGLNDDELVRFAAACAATAISRYPLQLDPPKIKEIEKLIASRNY